MTTQIQTNRRIVLATRPHAAADLSCFRLEAVPIDTPREGEMLVVKVGAAGLERPGGKGATA